jgi:hypothetical protein
MRRLGNRNLVKSLAFGVRGFAFGGWGLGVEVEVVWFRIFGLVFEGCILGFRVRRVGWKV